MKWNIIWVQSQKNNSANNSVIPFQGIAKQLDPRLRGDDKLYTIVTPAQAGGKHPSRALFLVPP